MKRSLLIIATLVACMPLAAAASARTNSPVVIKIGEGRTYSASRLHPGRMITCTYRGQTLTVTVPTKHFLSDGSVTAGHKNVFNLGVTRKKSGAYYVSCTRGGHHSEPVVVP